jgi:hypothetical protein
LKNTLIKTSPQRTSTADPVLAGAVEQTGVMLKIKATIILLLLQTIY